MRPTGARAAIVGESEAGYLDGVSPKRLQTEYARTARETAAFRRANMELRTRWTGAGWPTDYWAGQVYPDLAPLEGKRRLARDILWFCRLTDEDGPGTTGWTKHVRAIARRSQKLTKLELEEVELRGPGTELRIGLSPGTVWLGGEREVFPGVRIAPNIPTEETFTSPQIGAAEGTFACTVPLSFQGRLIHGLRGELRGGRLVHLEADTREDRDFVATYIDSDPTGDGRRLGEIGLVDATSRVGRAGRIYYSTLVDENAATHIAFGGGYGPTRARGSRGLNRSSVHLDVMIGSPDFEVTGITRKGRRVPVIADGLFV
jgi:aminopeptidase